MRPFSSIPFFRIILPYCTGILAAMSVTWHLSVWFPLLAAFALLLSLLKNKHMNRFGILVLADIFLLSFGFVMCKISERHPAVRYYTEYASDKNTEWLMQIDDVPVRKNNFLKTEVSILAAGQGSVMTRFSGKALLYIKNVQNSNQIEPGRIIQAPANFSSPPGPSNPGEFDYAAYLKNHHILAAGFTDGAGIRSGVKQKTAFSVFYVGLKIKQKIIALLRESNLNQATLAICAALLTGYDDEIEKGTITAFAHSGTLHVLSVSGLHTGLIYVVLHFLFSLVDKRGRHKITEFVIITFVLWSFALVSGFASPVLRAVIMFNLMGFGKLFFRQSQKNQLNVLLVSAFILLLYDPWLLRDAGFLLSYFAMFGLIYYQPLLNKFLNPQNYFSKSLWNSVSASFSATLSTLPLTLFMFRQFPFWFAICNIIVVPCSFLLLLLATAICLQIPGADYCANYLCGFMSWFISLFDSKGLGYIDQIDFGFTDAIFLSVFIALASLMFSYRSVTLVYSALGLLLVWQCWSLADSVTKKSAEELTVYNLKKSSALSLHRKKELLLLMKESSVYDFSVKPHVSSMNYPVISRTEFNCIEHHEQQYLLIDSLMPAVADPSRVRVFILRKGFRGKLPVSDQYVNLRKVIAESALDKKTLADAEELCAKFGIEFYSIKRSGAYLESF